MQQRIFGKTGWKVSEIGLGCWGLGGKAYGPIKDENSIQTIQYAYDQGVNFFDTADVYGFGHSEELLGKVLAGKKDVFIASKVGNDFDHGPIKKCWEPDYIESAVDKSLKRLNRETLDLCQLHNPTKAVIEEGTVFEVLEKLKQAGKIRFYGLSIFDPSEGILAIVKAPGLTSVQTSVNMIDQRSVEELFPLAKERNVALIAREPLANGILAGKISLDKKFPKDDHRAGWSKDKIEFDLWKFGKIKSTCAPKEVNPSQAAIEFVLEFEEVSVVIPGAKTVLQAQSNLAAANRQNLTSEEIQRIRHLYSNDLLFSFGF